MSKQYERADRGKAAVWRKARRPDGSRDAMVSPRGCACDGPGRDPGGGPGPGGGGHPPGGGGHPPDDGGDPPDDGGGHPPDDGGDPPDDGGDPPDDGGDGSDPARPFSPTSFWNTRLPSDAPLDPSSDLLVADLVDQVADYGPWINTYSYSSPVYTVGAHAPRVAVTLDKNAPTLAEAFASVPVPPDAEPADGNDAHMVVWQPATDTMWEFWHMQRGADGWHADWGGRMTGVSENPGHFLERDWGATATGLPLLGGLIRIDELRRGRIDHALDLSLVRTRRWVWSWPAQRTDGWIEGPTAIPEGAHFRLDPRLDLDALDLPPVTRMIAEAAQRYGVVIRDRGGAITFFGEDPSPTGTNPYYGSSGFFGGRSPDQLMRRFPWARLQLLRMDLRSNG